MTIRIVRDRNRPAKVLRVEGWLRGEEAVELLRATDASGSPVELDLRELRRSDRTGIELLRYLVEKGVRLRHVPPTITLLLEPHSESLRAPEMRADRSDPDPDQR